MDATVRIFIVENERITAEDISQRVRLLGYAVAGVSGTGEAALKECIEPAGHECRSYQNPRKALQQFKRESFDAVICDLRMPELDGIQLLTAIQELRPGTPVVILTGYAETESAISAVNHGAFAFL